MREHPQYNGLLIHEGPKGDKPRAGAFYQPKKGDTLSWIGVRAGVPWRKINWHTWNVEHLPEYRAKSDRCTSRKLTGADRYEGFISMCPSVAFGQFQVIWIPPKNGMGPDELLGQASGLKPEDTKPSSYTDTPVKDTSQVKRLLLNTGVKVQAPLTKTVTSVAAPKPEVPWAIIGAISVVAIGMFVAVTK